MDSTEQAIAVVRKNLGMGREAARLWASELEHTMAEVDKELANIFDGQQKTLDKESERE